jgi:hypothetical protein
LRRHEDRLSVYPIGQMSRRQSEEDHGQRASQANESKDRCAVRSEKQLVTDSSGHRRTPQD